MPRTIWIDVEDLFEYARGNPRPSGVQRLAFEICAALQARHGADGRIRFVRHASAGDALVDVGWPAIEALFTDLARMAPQPSGGPSGALRLLRDRLPERVRAPLRRFVALQNAAIATLRGTAGDAPGAPASTPASPGDAPGDGAVADRAADRRAPGADVLLLLGASWSHPDYPRVVERVRRRHGLRVAVLFYDLIPLRRPEWCDPGLARRFTAWIDGMLPLCDWAFAISRATAADVEHYAGRRGVALPGPVRTVPIGTGFGTPALTDPPAIPGRLPPAGGYVLFVSTIEPRKNHPLLVQVWRQLLEELPRAEVPTLVFAGRIGWMVADLMRQLENTDLLDGAVAIVRDPTDGELTALYRGCLFTVFPSLFEGWGLPVTESLAFGKPCVIAGTTSLPEAGGTLARYFDPDSVPDAYRVIRATIGDRAGLAEWEARIGREFRPVPWAATAEALIAGLAEPGAAPAEARRPMLIQGGVGG